VIDFGVARPDDATAIPRVGTVLGTPGFMAPEQVRGALAGPAADVFALAAVLAYAATGREPLAEWRPRWHSAGNEQVPGTARPGATTLPATTTTTVPLTPITDAGTSTAEFVVSGDATVYSLTITVNGQAETVTNVALPWRIDYHHGPGDFSCQILVDGSDRGSGGSSSTSQDIRDSHNGTL
jgi:serine/threonine protein kinase